MNNRIEAINSELRRGDMTTVASIVGCSSDLVRRVIKYPAGHYKHRNPDSTTGKKIIRAMEQIIRDRKRIKNALKTSGRKAA